MKPQPKPTHVRPPIRISPFMVYCLRVQQELRRKAEEKAAR